MVKLCSDIFRRARGVKPSPAEGDITWSGILSHLHPYGFTEVSDVLNRGLSAAGASPGRLELHYVRERLETCLARHDGGEDWFIPMRELLRDVDAALRQGR